MRMHVALSVIVLLITAAHGRAEEPPAAGGKNPFERSPRIVAESPRAESSAIHAPTFTLRATMTAGAQSLVNVEGEILQLGDEFTGYRLVAVGEGTAVFARNGVHYPVFIKAMTRDDEQQDDEPQDDEPQDQ